MFLVGVLQFGSIDDSVVRSDEGEDQGGNKGDSHGCAKRGPDSAVRQLYKM